MLQLFAIPKNHVRMASKCTTACTTKTSPVSLYVLPVHIFTDINKLLCKLDQWILCHVSNVEIAGASFDSGACERIRECQLTMPRLVGFENGFEHNIRIVQSSEPCSWTQKPPISGLKNEKYRVKYKLNTKITSRANSFNAFLYSLVVPTIIANLPVMKVDIRSWSIPPSIDFADQSFHVPKKIEMIIGTELFIDLLKNGRMKLTYGSPMLVETDLGWIVSDPVKAQSSVPSAEICQLNLREEQINRTLWWSFEN